ncbi:MAG: hypothetical protein H6742_02470 [Alphaproteobacteria bacterium]|nr:hypothetical protein [Alphaproteobacteria bacterium]
MRKVVPPLLVLLSLSPLLGGAACVVQYGTEPVVRPAEPQAPPGDFAEVQDRFEDLYSGEVEVDRRDRLDAAMDLLRRGRTMPPDEQAAVLAYLKRLLAIEERAQPMEAPELFGAAEPGQVASFTPVGTVIEEEDLGGVEQVEQPPGDDGEGDDGSGSSGEGAAEPAGATDDDPPVDDAPVTTDPVGQARAALAAGDPPGALAALAPCGAIDCGDGADALAAQARDAWIHTERERAGALFVRARSEPDPVERSARLVEARDILASLLERFPDASQADDLRRNISLVQAELDAVR